MTWPLPEACAAASHASQMGAYTRAAQVEARAELQVAEVQGARRRHEHSQVGNSFHNPKYWTYLS